MIRKRVAKNRDGELQLTIKVTGIQDVYRFASHMLTGQTEFAKQGELALRSLRRQIPRENWVHMLRSLAGPATRRFRP